MTLRLPDKWVWDFWLAQDGPDYHIFYLQAPRSLQDAHLRHWNASVGHAVSQNLSDWQILPDVLAPSPLQPGMMPPLGLAVSSNKPDCGICSTPVQVTLKKVWYSALG